MLCGSSRQTLQDKTAFELYYFEIPSLKNTTLSTFCFYFLSKIGMRSLCAFDFDMGNAMLQQKLLFQLFLCALGSSSVKSLFGPNAFFAKFMKKELLYLGALL